MSHRCTATNRSGQQCRQIIADEFPVCVYHGGAAPQVRAKAEERRALARAQRLVELLDAGPCTDPVGALLDLAGQAKALVDILRAVVAQLDEVAYRGGIGDGQEQVRGELSAYISAMGRAESVLGRILSLGLEERRVRVVEAQADLLEAALVLVLRHPDLGLDGVRIERARELLSVELTRAEDGSG